MKKKIYKKEKNGQQRRKGNEKGRKVRGVLEVQQKGKRFRKDKGATVREFRRIS